MSLFPFLVGRVPFGSAGSEADESKRGFRAEFQDFEGYRARGLVLRVEKRREKRSARNEWKAWEGVGRRGKAWEGVGRGGKGWECGQECRQGTFYTFGVWMFLVVTSISSVFFSWPIHSSEGGERGRDVFFKHLVSRSFGPSAGRAEPVGASRRC